MPVTTVISYGADGSVSFASGNFLVDVNGVATLNGIQATGDDIPINCDLRFQAGVGPVIQSPNGTKYRVKVDDDGNVGSSNA